MKTIVNGKPVGSTIDVPKGDAEYLISKGLAEEVKSAPKKTETKPKTKGTTKKKTETKSKK